MIYNSYGESFYIKGADINVTTGFPVAAWSWFMPLLFCVAGISSDFALKRRTLGEYFACFLLGYFVLSQSKVMEQIVKYRFCLLMVTALSMIGILLYWNGFFDTPMEICTLSSLGSEEKHLEEATIVVISF